MLCLDFDPDGVGWEHKRLERAEAEWQEQRKALPDLTKKEKIKKTATAELSKLKSMFGSK